MGLYLESKEGVWELEDGDHVIGRVSDCEICIKEPRISRQHAIVHVSGNMVVIEDLGSANGILVNGDRITEQTVLMPNDSLVCGPILFRLRMVSTSSVKVSTTAEMNSPFSAAASQELLPHTDFTCKKSERDPGFRPDSDFPIEPSTNEPQSAPSKIKRAKTGAALTERRRQEDAADRRIDAGIGQAVQERDSTKYKSSDEHLPSDHAKYDSDEMMALQRMHESLNDNLHPSQVRESAILEAESKTPGVGRRAAAALLDWLQMALVSVVLVLAILTTGYLVAGLRDVDSGVSTPSLGGRLLGLTTAEGLELAWNDIKQWHGENAPAFVVFFGAATLGLLAIILSVLFHQVVPTVLKGAPFWHRRLRLEVIDRGTRSYVTAGRACLRCLLLLVLWPVALVCLLLGRTGPHDAVIGSKLNYR